MMLNASAVRKGLAGGRGGRGVGSWVKTGHHFVNKKYIVKE